MCFYPQMGKENGPLLDRHLTPVQLTANPRARASLIGLQWQGRRPPLGPPSFALEQLTAKPRVLRDFTGRALAE